MSWLFYPFLAVTVFMVGLAVVVLVRSRGRLDRRAVGVCCVAAALLVILVLSDWTYPNYWSAPN